MDCVLHNEELSVSLSGQGGSLTSISAFGREYLWQGDPAVWSGQAPICFPICGGLRDGRARLRSGAEVVLARHGFARKQAFELVSHDETTAVLRLVSTPELQEGYPFDFKLDARYAIDGTTLSVTYEVTNTGMRDMPFFIGGHPAFRCPLDEGERYEDYRIVFELPETESVPRAVVETGLIDVDARSAGPQQGRVLALSHDLFAVSETIYDRLASREVTLENGDGTHGVRVSFPDMPYLVVWGKPAGDFVAIEPWGGLSTCSDEGDLFEDKRGCLVARPGETVSRGFTVKVF